MTNPAYFEVGRFLGGYGFMNITSYSSSQFGESSNVAGIQDLGLGYSAEELQRLRVQDIGEGEVAIRLYEGRVVQGPLRGTQAVFKVYPGAHAGASEADLMALNELRTHAFLQSDASNICDNIQFLLGAFETATGEQISARQYLRNTLNNDRYSSVGAGALSDGLWRRASAAGASTPLEKRAFGIADDMQRLLENTFRLDIYAAREYCLADERLLEAVNFLDLGHGAGWELLQAMLNPDYRKRPIAEAVLNHRFITGAVLRNY
ncbi:uncharacterized protein C2845_PM12G24010 [Panicum miliaceum]|uniref:Protein kinase domain-containing protein n=1 Tax=Panicum miliaceum TaxID=4540 RepID=A0A3L6QHX7_PANMI|nr:uncharacterized protein C2845_PM12G24010 [Panicum miliaceum]